MVVKTSRLLLPAIFMATLTAVIYWMSVGRSYYPVMTVTLPGNEGKLLFVERPWRTTDECGDSIQKMRTALGTTCTPCRIHSECTASPDSRWIDALRNHPINQYVVRSDTLRILLDTPAAVETCRAMADEISRSGKTTGQCIAPQ